MLLELLERTANAVTHIAQISNRTLSDAAHSTGHAARALIRGDRDASQSFPEKATDTSGDHAEPFVTDSPRGDLDHDPPDSDPELTARFRHDFGISAGAGHPSELPVMLRGFAALQQLRDRYGDAITFHGSHLSLTRLEPRQATWGLDPPVPDGAPAICVDKGYEIPVFMSLFKRLGDQNVRLAYFTDDVGEVHYYVEGIRSGAIDTDSLIGFVHVLPRKAFTEITLPIPEGFDGPGKDHQRNPELRAFEPLKPLAIVEVRFSDFPRPIESDPP